MQRTPCRPLTRAAFRALNSAAKCIDNPQVVRGRSAANDRTTHEADGRPRSIL